MRNMTLENIAAACGGTLIGGRAAFEGEISFITTDSREAAGRCLFAAIKGNRSDGHDYIGQAASSGAACCLCERAPDSCGCAVIVVPSTPAALREIAAFYRRQFQIPFVGITGSVGKTTAKDMVASVLSQRFKVLKTSGNLNNALGVPLTIFRLRDEHEAAIIEMGVSDFGEMSALAEIVRPSVALYTAIGDSHLECLGSREGVLKAKSEMLPYVDESGAVFVNGDDELLRELKCRQKKKSFGRNPYCELRAENIENPGFEETEFDIVTGGKSFHARVRGFGAHMVNAALEGAAVGLYMGLGDAEVQAGIAAYEPEGGHTRIIDAGRFQIIDDCYNANPTSTLSAIISMRAAPGRGVCILGDMLELGERSKELHNEIGRAAAQSGAALIICCGKEAEHIFSGALKAKGAARALYFPEKAELIPALAGLIREGDTVLVKASRGMKFEDIVEALEAEGTVCG